MNIKPIVLDDRLYGHIGWKHGGIRSKVHWAEMSPDGQVYLGAPTLCGGRVTNDPDDELDNRGKHCGNCRRKAGIGRTRKTGIDEIVRHVKAKSTGATVIVQRIGPGSNLEQEPGWMTTCLDHGLIASHESRLWATRHSSHPEGWCDDCQLIADGKRPYIDGPKKR